MEVITNKIETSGLITLDLTQYLPEKESIAAFDIKPFLFKELILKEKEYRKALKNHDWQIYQGKHVAIFCSTDAIIPLWAYMLATTYLQSVAASVHFSTPDTLATEICIRHIEAINPEEYTGKKVIIKGCGDKEIPEAAYVAISTKLLPVVHSLMYGEACSTVPVYKKKA